MDIIDITGVQKNLQNGISANSTCNNNLQPYYIKVLTNQ